MSKNLLLLVLVIVSTWFARDYYDTTLSTDEPLKHQRHSETSTPSGIATPHRHTPKNETVTKNVPTLSELLEKGLFYDALSLYLEDSSAKHRKQIENYLSILAKKNPLLALEYMQVFLDNVPESDVHKLMIHTYIALDDLPKAIELIMEAKENYTSEREDQRLAKQLKEVAVDHIEALLKREDYGTLIAFLEEMIAYDSTDNYYKFRLVKLYMKLDKMDEASVLLDVIKYDEVYAQNVQSLLGEIEQEEEETYDYAIPLQRFGSHFVAAVSLDGNIFHLMLDTGATFIFLDEEKASMLEVMQEDVTLQTAGNDIRAKLGKVSSLHAGNLQLSNIQVTIAPFQREGIDGLLGMNFFKQFRFYIDQEENVLYLNHKTTSH